MIILPDEKPAKTE